MPILNSAPTEHDSMEGNARRLATASGLGSVTMCDCGTLSLNIQAMSLRLDVKAFAQLLLLCSEAMGVIEAIAHCSTDDNQQPAGSPPNGVLIH